MHLLKIQHSLVVLSFDTDAVLQGPCQLENVFSGDDQSDI